MATALRRRTAPPPPVRTAPTADLQRRLVWEYVDINDIAAYEFNPRDNAAAIPAVAESIKAFGFLVPVVIDAAGILVAGHTRVEAAKLLGLSEVPAVRAGHLTEEQINAFRLIDNKVAEQAKWDFDLLAGEIGKLSDSGLDFTSFGWSQEEIDCLSEVVAADCLNPADVQASAEATGAANQARRSPQTARFVLGEIVFFTTSNQYRVWVDGIRQLHDFNEDAISADLKRRLGILE